jgi:hypothetical protein
LERNKKKGKMCHNSDACKLAGESEQMNSVSNHKGVAEILKILAAIPCYNEGLAIGSVALKAKRYVDEVLVVDDGSIDDTAEVAEAAGAAVVAHDGNNGYGAAIRSCFNYAKQHNFGIMVILDFVAMGSMTHQKYLILFTH